MDNKARSYPEWLRRIPSRLDVGIHRLRISVNGNFAELFAEFCTASGLEFERESDRIETDPGHVFYVEYRRNLDHESFQDDLDALPLCFADYLREKYGENPPNQ